VKDKEIDAWLRDEPVCPYCGHVHEDVESPKHWEGKCECSECGKFFDCELEYSVTYSSTQMPCWNGSPHEFKRCAGFPDTPGEKVPFNCKHCGFTEWRDSMIGATENKQGEQE
jgi:hypothetical protein